QLGLGLAVLAFATASHARIFVIINDGVTGLNGSNLTGCDSFQKNDSNDPACFIGNFRLSRFSPQLPDTDTINYQTDVMPLLGCSPCTVYFPSASTTQQSTDTFAFSDTNPAGPFARIVKFDGATSADRISARGITVRALKPGLTLTFTYSTQNGDLRTVPFPPSPATAAMSGSFRNSSGIARAAACGDGTTSTSVGTPCVKLQIKVNGTTVDGQGVSAIASTAVPCN